MSSKFLYSSATTDLSVLQDGTFALKVASATIDELTPNQYVKTDGEGKLVSAGTSTISPLTADLDIGAFDVVGLSGGQTLNGISDKILDTEAKVVNIISASFSTTTTMQGILRTDQVATDKVSNQLESDYIDLSTGGINITTSSLTLNGNPIVSNPYVPELEASSFKKTGGTNNQYLMADGSSLQFSSNSGNSNFYMYKSHAGVPFPPPADGFIYYNHPNQSLARIIYISHITDDSIDIEIFFSNLSQLNDVYIQQKSQSSNFIRYNISAPATIIAGSYISIPVYPTSYGGTGETSFGVNEPILLSFFTNTIETSLRITEVENKTVNQTAVFGTTNFYGTGGIITSKISLDSGTGFLKADGVVDTNTYALNSALTTTNSNITTLQNKTVNMTAIDSISNTFSGMNGIVASRFSVNGTSTQFLKADGSVDSTTYALNSGLTTLQGKTQNQSATTTTTTFTGTGGIISDKFIKTGGGLATEFLKSDGSFDSNTYIQSVSITNSSVPYINAIGKVSSAVTNLYVQRGINTIQSAVDAVISGQSYSIQLSSGGFAESIVCSKENYILSGVSCPLFAPSTSITGNLTIGVVGVSTTRIKIQNILCGGNLTFSSDIITQALRTYISNCEFQSSITFPTQAVYLTWIYFFDCSFSGSTPITFPNISYVVVFTRCNFNGQAITSNVLSSALITFRDCTGLGTVTGLCTYFGVNALTSAVSTLTATGLALGGMATSLIKGDGSAISGTSSQIVLGNATLLTGTATSLVRGNATTISGTSSQIVLGNATLLTGTSSSFVKGDATLDSTVYVPINTGLVGYSGRKFTSSVVSLGGVQSNSPMIASVLGSNTIGANEAQLGDCYRIFVAGNFNNKTVAPAITTITITMFGKPQVITLPALMTTGLKNYSLTYDLIVIAVGTAVNLFCSSVFTSGDPIHSPVVNLTSLTPVNTTTANTLAITYNAPAGSGTNEMSVYMVYMCKI